MLLAIALATALLAPSDKIAVYVAMPIRDGYVDAGKAIADSKRDLEREIAKRKRLRAVARREDAAIVLTVLDRGIVSEDTGGLVFIPFGHAVVAKPTRRSWNALHARLDVGDYSRYFTGQFAGIGDVWEECAEQIAKELDGWVAANHGRLTTTRRQ